jgi:anti-sigma factor RsiW
LNCELAQTTVHGYFDGELDAVRSAEFEHHLETCTQCQAALESIERLSKLMATSNLYERASAQLRERVRKQLAPTPRATTIAGRKRNWLLLPAVALSSAALAAMIIAFVLIPSRNQSARITAELIDAHVRSLQQGHLTDVQSTDQHTVKPWFDGKLNFIPPVTDYSAQGFPLVGGRLDVIDGHDVAALIYSRRKHLINVFVWPSSLQLPNFTPSGSQQGFNWLTWESGDMRFCAVSDVSGSDLRQLKDLFHP